MYVVKHCRVQAINIIFILLSHLILKSKHFPVTLEIILKYFSGCIMVRYWSFFNCPPYCTAFKLHLVFIIIKS